MWLLLLLTIFSVVALVLVFAGGYNLHPLGYVSYVVSFYTLRADTAFCAVTFPRYYRAVRQKINAKRYGNRYLTDVAFKKHESLYAALAVNLLYVITNVCSCISLPVAWFGVLAVYYTILAVMRFLLLRFFNRIGIGCDLVREYRRSRLCGMILMTLNLTLSGTVLMIIHQNKGYEYHGMLIYVVAMYTFYVAIHAVISVIKYRKHQSPVMSTAKIISLSAALVSMLVTGNSYAGPVVPIWPRHKGR